MPVSKKVLEGLMREHHYLSKVSISFKSGFNVGLIHKDKVVGGCIFTGFPVPELSQSCFGLERDDQNGLWELSRFVLEPSHQTKEHNLATWFMARAIKLLRANEYTSQKHRFLLVFDKELKCKWQSEDWKKKLINNDDSSRSIKL